MNFILKGNICYSETPQSLQITENGYLVCEDSRVTGVYRELPEAYANLPITDYGDSLIVPGLCDLHTHAPQYTFRGLGMDMQLLDWLQTYTFPEESLYSDLEYADKAYTLFSNAMLRGATTRACIYATIHPQATTLLMEKLEQAGIVSMVGLIGMDRNCPEALRFDSADVAYNETRAWIESTKDRFKNTSPIITPRFIPTSSNELMIKLKELQKKYSLPVQSHLSENKAEIDWVKKLCPEAETYSHAYNQFGLFGGTQTPTIMAHCVWLEEIEKELINENNVFIAHCPQSNTNIASGIAPIRKYLQQGLNVGLGSDVAGGCHLSIFRAMSDAIQVSKLNWCLLDHNDSPLTINEAFYLGTKGGGSFFGNVGSFESGYEFDAVVINDINMLSTRTLSIEERLARVIYDSDDSQIVAKYVRGRKVYVYEAN